MTREHESMTSVPEQAAHWWAVLHDGDASPAEKREFAAWIAQGPERVEAMLRLARLHKALSRLREKWPAPSAEKLIVEAKAARADSVLPLRPRNIPTREPPRRPSMRVAAGLAAALVLAVGMSWFALARPQNFETRIGEQRSVVLADGSRVTLNTASRISVRLRADRRIIDLVKGEALFEVVPDAQRPFDVRVGTAVVRAVGTQFDIDRRVTRTVVTVVEGRVAVIADGARLERAPVLSAGDRVVVDAEGPEAVQKSVNLSETTAWTQRQLVFRNRPLGEIAEELNRYNVTRVEIRSPTLRSQQVTGTFQTDGVASFIALLSGIPGVHVVGDDSGGYIVTSQELTPPRQ